MEFIAQIYVHLPLWLNVLCLLVMFVVAAVTARLVLRYRLKRLALVQQK